MSTQNHFEKPRLRFSNCRSSRSGLKKFRILPAICTMRPSPDAASWPTSRRLSMARAWYCSVKPSSMPSAVSCLSWNAVMALCTALCSAGFHAHTWSATLPMPLTVDRSRDTKSADAAPPTAREPHSISPHRVYDDEQDMRTTPCDFDRGRLVNAGRSSKESDVGVPQLALDAITSIPSARMA
jgi:hypothetical protein